MAGDQSMRRRAVAVLAPTLGQHVFLLRLQHREPADLSEIVGEAGFIGENRQRRGVSHKCALQIAPADGGQLQHRKNKPTRTQPPLNCLLV